MTGTVCRQLSEPCSASKQTESSRNAGIDVKWGNNELLKLFKRSAGVSSATTLLSGIPEKDLVFVLPCHF